MTVQILTGDAREVLKTLRDESVHCVVTSPPYWGLRAYKGDPGMIGLEPTFDEHLANLVEVFREVRRVLRKDGTLWLNYGDAYKGKSLLMMPARVAMALQDEGWILRSEIIWHKRNPTPESVSDRPFSAYEKIFLLTKSPQYFYDQDGVRVPYAPRRESKDGRFVNSLSTDENGHREKAHAPRPQPNPLGCNMRNVWYFAKSVFSGAHFATFPRDLVDTCIKAGCPEGGTVLDPFGGAGTVGLVADRLQRDAILIEISEEYADMARDRIRNDAPLFTVIEGGA